MDTAWTWELSGYCAKYSFLTEPKGLTMREVERIFQLDPEPPVRGNLNDYILETVQSRDLRWFSFFLHHYENRLNGRVRRFQMPAKIRKRCSCCGRGWIAMTQNAFWTTKWDVFLPCWTVSRDTIPHKGQIF